MVIIYFDFVYCWCFIYFFVNKFCLYGVYFGNINFLVMVWGKVIKVREVILFFMLYLYRVYKIDVLGN